MPPHPGFFPSASGYLLIGYSKISETRRYRRKKRGRRAGEKTRTRRKREMGRGGWKGGGTKGGWGQGGAKREGTRWEGCRGPYARVGVNYHYPPKTRLSFCSREFLFVSFPVARPHPLTHPPPPSEGFDSSARLCRPFHPLSSSVRFLFLSSSSTLPITVHLKYEFDITFHPTALARPPPRTSSFVPSRPRFRSPPSPPPRHGRPTITGPRTI